MKIFLTNTNNRIPAPFLTALKQWVERQGFIDGLLLVGSHANEIAQEHSDIDFILITEEPQRLLDDLSWTELFGRVRDQSLEDDDAVTSIRTTYQDGRTVEYGVTTSEWAKLNPVDPATRDVVKGGAKVIWQNGTFLSDLIKRVRKIEDPIV